jgi:hypothetical protein
MRGRSAQEGFERDLSKVFLKKMPADPRRRRILAFWPALTRQPSSLASREAQIDRIRAVMGAPSGKVPCVLVTGQAATGKTGLLRDAMAAAGRESNHALQHPRSLSCFSKATPLLLPCTRGDHASPMLPRKSHPLNPAQLPSSCRAVLHPSQVGSSPSRSAHTSHSASLHPQKEKCSTT